MRTMAMIVGVAWMVIFVATGIWLGFSQLFLDSGGVLFKSGAGNIGFWLSLAMPGYLLWNWGRRKKESS